MRRVDTFTEAADQVTTLVLPDNTLLQLALKYRPTIQRWTVDVSHPLLTVRGLNVCVSLNLLRQWRNLIPFGMSCDTSDGADVAFPTDFSSGRAALYGLTTAEVLQVESTIAGIAA